jgi:opacity protein-like surface antigen
MTPLRFLIKSFPGKEMKRIIVIIALLMFIFTGRLFAEDILGFGLHLGAQSNVGNINTYSPGFDLDPRENFFLGFSIKMNLAFLFIRSGVDTFTKSASSIDNRYTAYKANFLGIPAFFGLSYRIQNTGEFYMGGGLAHFYVWGTVKDASKDVNIDTGATTYGVLMGMQLNVSTSARLYLEWIYLDGSTEPVLGSKTSGNYKELYIKLTGNRIQFGVMYYLL